MCRQVQSEDDEPAARMASLFPAGIANRMNLSPGQTLSQYRLVEQIGEGGMGVVWRAIDTTLDRQVAIKILPQQFVGDPERLSRFEREAKLLASLHNPGIASIYGLHEAGGIHFLAMELAEGEDLSRRLSRGLIPVDEAVEIARQIAAALEAAHDSGVIHRDLKPANVQIAPSGEVKLLDFGLAKAFDPIASGAPGADPSLSPTLTSVGTAVGVILGTAAYMSPEQARGQAVDKRADIWGFGCVLFEMLTGTPVFAGDTVSDTLAAVLRAEPAWDRLPSGLPPVINGLLRRCLEKKVKQRLRDIGEARIVLEGGAAAGGMEIAAGGASLAHPAGAAPGPPAERKVSGWRRPFTWIVFAFIGLFALSIWRTERSVDRRPPLARFAVTLPLELSLDYNDTPNLAISPDGGMLVFAARQKGTLQLYLRTMERMEANPIPGTEGGDHPFFSPDGQWLGFFAEGALKKISVNGGPAMRIADAGLHRGGCWGPDGTIVFSPRWNTGLVKVSAEGGTPVALTTPDQDAGERTHRWPDVLPDGKSVLFVIGTLDSPGDYEDAPIAIADMNSGERRPLSIRGSIARYVPSGHIVYSRGGTLLVVPFDADRLEVTGPSAPVQDKVAGIASSGAVFFDVADDGTLIYVPGTPRAQMSELAWIDRQGQVTPLPLPAGEYQYVDLSPDDRYLALSVGPGRGRGDDVWIYDIARDTLTRLTFNGSSFAARWTPDGKRVAYTSATGTTEGIVWKPADGSAPEERVAAASLPLVADSFSPNGRLLLMSEIGGAGNGDLHLLDLDEPDAGPRPIVASASVELAGSISPDGRWFAYSSDESGNAEIYVQPFPGLGGKWQVSIDGGEAPLWSPAGDEIFFRNGDQLLAAPVRVAPTFAAGKPRLEFEQGTPVSSLAPLPSYDVTSDGKRILAIIRAGGHTEADRVNVVLNWFEEVRARAPAADD
jgi:serine/threonine-protein kinase